LEVLQYTQAVEKHENWTSNQQTTTAQRKGCWRSIKSI